MKDTAFIFFFRSLLGFMLLTATFPLKASEKDVFDRVIRIPQTKATIYQLLGKITEQTGLLFIYDSKLIDNEKVHRIKAGDYTIREAIYEITGDKNLDLQLIGKHILISLPDITEKEKDPPSYEEIDLPHPQTSYPIEGVITDRLTKEPLAYAAISIKDHSIGTITNQEGEFRLMIPDTIPQPLIQFTYLGYLTSEIDASVLRSGHHTITLEPQEVSIQEVIIRRANPHRLLKDLMDNRVKNYATEPVYHTSFYREGIERKGKLTSLTEAVFRIYKTPYTSLSTDQVKLLKMRNIIDEGEKDTLVTKFKSGIQASLQLDIIKNPTEFLSNDNENIYAYYQNDMAVIDGRLAYVIAFESTDPKYMPVYSGQLYVDIESEALISARFEFDPQYVKKSSNIFITRKSRDLSITPQKVTYTVSYKLFDGIYYINHIRGDLHFRVRKKRQLFSNTPVHFWFEMVTCKTETENVRRFPRSESMATHTIFSETKATYDATFWENFNVILPEEQLNDAIGKITAKIEEIVY